MSALSDCGLLFSENFRPSVVPYLTAEKMIYVIVTVPVFCSEMPVDDFSVICILNIGSISADIMRLYVRHNLNNPLYLIYTDIRVRFSKMQLIAVKIIFKYCKRLLNSIRARSVALCNITLFNSFFKCLKIKKQNITYS